MWKYNFEEANFYYVV